MSECHQTGGAVDLTLCNCNGIPLEMGSEYPVKCLKMATSYILSSIQRLCIKRDSLTILRNGGIFRMVINFGLHTDINVMRYMVQ